MRKRVTLEPRELGLIIDAVRDKLKIIDGITRRNGGALAIELGSEYRVLFDKLQRRTQ